MDTEKYTEREKEIYRQYQSVIAYFIAELEVRDTEYPIEIFNEIRSVFTHLSRYKLQGSIEDLASAERHIKRATLDCFKYMCVSIAEEIDQFRKAYRKVDLKLADNGRFLPKLDRLEHQARNAFVSAKRAEIKGEISEDELYSLFEEAYNKYAELSQHLSASHEAILFASSHSRSRNRVTLISIVVTVISIVIAVVIAVSDIC